MLNTIGAGIVDNGIIVVVVVAVEFVLFPESPVSLIIRELLPENASSFRFVGVGVGETVAPFSDWGVSSPNERVWRVITVIGLLVS